MKIFAQDSTDYFNPGFLRFENYIYKPFIKTVILERENEPLSQPLIELAGEKKLSLRFDDLRDESANYYYRFVHCDFNWQPSALHSSDYTEGFFYEQIADYNPSFNTYQVYYHYHAVFPTEQMRITKSGNYVLVVYDNNNPEEAIITWRFKVIDSRVSVDTKIHRATIIEKRNSHQEIDFSINYTNYPLSNPIAELKVAIQQNGRWDNCINNLLPLFVKENEVEYNYEEENIFNGGNEYRYVDIRSTRFYSPYTAKIFYDSLTLLNHVVLKPDESRSFQRYSILDDINGKFLVKIYDGRNDNTEADYVNVDFTLKYSEPLANGNFYLLGSLTNNSVVPWSKMKYDYTDHSYKTSLVLKQGYYNYQYVWVEDGKTLADETRIEGNHFECENEYEIFVYRRDPSVRYDQLIGYKKLNSKNIY